jgi:phosphoglycerol transferase MdoB-like AlkP superfamily enzyme
MYFLLFFEFLDLFSFFFSGSSVSVRFIRELNPAILGQRTYGYLALFIVGIYVTLLVAFLGRMMILDRSSKLLDAPKWFMVMAYSFTAISGFYFVDKVRVRSSTIPRETYFSSKVEGKYQKLRRFLNSPIRSTLYPWRQKRNLITFIIESFDIQFMGQFNLHGLNEMMPYVSSLANSSLFCVNVPSEEFARTCHGSLLAAQCGIPLTSDAVLQVAMQKSGHNSLKCLGDVLEHDGYRMLAINSGVTSTSEWVKILKRHGYAVVRCQTEGITDDKKAMDDLLDGTLDDLANGYRRGIPFSLIVNFADSGKGKFVTCQARPIAGTHPAAQMLDCVDQRIKELFKRLKELGIKKSNTEFVIYGDHPMYGAWPGLFDGAGRRNVPVIFVSSRHQVIEDPVSIYDLIPTILHNLAVNYEPEWPYGHVVGENSPTVVPGGTDFKVLERLFAKPV